MERRNRKIGKGSALRGLSLHLHAKHLTSELMPGTEDESLSRRILELENELEVLRYQLKEKSRNQVEHNDKLPLELEEYVRYGRQMILPQVGLPGQLALKRSSVLVVGAGGLGCPVLLYLVAAGVGIHPHLESSLTAIGTVGIADTDRVDTSNLHRQILHRTNSVGELKVLSAQRALKQYYLANLAKTNSQTQSLCRHQVL
jgi:adenylyltransferase/sulfurtransferase